MGNKCPKCGCTKLTDPEEYFDSENMDLVKSWSCMDCKFEFSDIWEVTLTYKHCEDLGSNVIEPK